MFKTIAPTPRRSMIIPRQLFAWSMVCFGLSLANATFAQPGCTGGVRYDFDESIALEPFSITTTSAVYIHNLQQGDNAIDKNAAAVSAKSGSGAEVSGILAPLLPPYPPLRWGGYYGAARGYAIYTTSRPSGANSEDTCLVTVKTSWKALVSMSSSGISASVVYRDGALVGMPGRSIGRAGWFTDVIKIRPGETKSAPTAVAKAALSVKMCADRFGANPIYAVTLATWEVGPTSIVSSECNATGAVDNSIPPLPPVAASQGEFPDADGDSLPDALDYYPDISLDGRLDTDEDGIPDDCDPACVLAGMSADLDDDSDGYDDDIDNCPLFPNPDQANGDGDDLGDFCDPTIGPDADHDGVIDSEDNCIITANPDQEDLDEDGVGDLCAHIGC